MARSISVIVIGALLAGLFAGTAAAEALVGANGGDGMVGTGDAAGGTTEAVGRRGIVGAHGVRDLVAGTSEGGEGMDGPALQDGSPGHGARLSSDGDGAVAVGPGNGFAFAAAESREPRPVTDDPTGPPGGTAAADQAGRIIVRYARGVDEGEADAPIFVAAGSHGAAYLLGP